MHARSAAEVPCCGNSGHRCVRGFGSDDDYRRVVASGEGPSTSSDTNEDTLPYPRTGRGLEFDRVANFSDAVFAIALTIIAVELHPPLLDLSGDASELLHKLGEMADELVIFFIAFAVMGSYWLANHRFVAGLRGVNSSYASWTLVYLAWVAFLPFPAALMGRYFENPVAVSVFAINVAVVSLLEWVLLWRAQTGGLLTRCYSPEGFRWASIGSLSPVVIFLVSIPVMWISTSLGVLLWASNIPAGFYLSSREPKALTVADG